MNDASHSAKTSHISSSSLAPTSQATASSSIRSRNRRVDSNAFDTHTASQRSPSGQTGFPSAFDASQRGRSGPHGSNRYGASPNRSSDDAKLGQFLGDSWSQSWASVQGFASKLISARSDQGNFGSRPQSLSRDSSHSATRTRGNPRHSNSKAWGPNPSDKNPELSDVAAGSLEQRQFALRAARTASVLESHEGVNGGLDITGKHKRRNSDEAAAEDIQPDNYLVYIHNVQTSDTYAGLILRYKCREDAFRKANGLWSRDSVQTRKWLTIPVDACDIRGRPCDPPSWHDSYTADLLAATPPAVSALPISQQTDHDDFLGRSNNDKPGSSQNNPGENKPWAHVRWVQIDSFQQPVEIGRIARQAMGYFPPRRKKSIVTTSSVSTPRQSSDYSIGATPGSTERTKSRRQSSLNDHLHLSGTFSSPRSRAGNELVDGRPAWMRGPGGVGTMSRSVHAPGPDKDYFNSWAKKHVPALNVEGVPSMSIMGSETARFGFSGKSSGLVESPFEDGRDVTATSQQGTALDKAAAAVETWLRGALARRPSTSLVGGRSWSAGGGPRRPIQADSGDLIELADTASDDGRLAHEPVPSHQLHASPTITPSMIRLESEGDLRGLTGQRRKGYKAN